MTELERILKSTLTTMEQELTATLETHSKTLAEQQRILAAHNEILKCIQEQNTQITTEQQESAQHLQRLSDIHANLEPLLSRLNALLNGK